MSELCGNRLRRGGWRVHGGVMTPYHVVGAACTLPKGHAGPCEPDRSTYAHVDSDGDFDLLHQDTDTR